MARQALAPSSAVAELGGSSSSGEEPGGSVICATMWPQGVAYRNPFSRPPTDTGKQTCTVPNNKQSTSNKIPSTAWAPLPMRNHNRQKTQLDKRRPGPRRTLNSERHPRGPHLRGATCPFLANHSESLRGTLLICAYRFHTA